MSDDITQDEIQKKRDQYQATLNRLEGYRKKQADRHTNPNARKAVITETRKHLEDTLRQHIFPAWYGTDWAFSGISKTPGEGQIACGYFVSTCLQQIGYKVNRIKLAQQPSQRIIETFMAKADRDILAGGKSMAQIRDYLKKQGDGIYIVGLDRHVGFISVTGDNMAFIHSSYYEPGSFVKSELIDSKNPLSDSQYRVFGKIFSDEMVRAWITQKAYTVKTN